MLPGHHRTVSDGLEQPLSTFLIFCLGQFLAQIQVIPASDTVFDQPLAALGDFLLLLLCLDELARVAD